MTGRVLFEKYWWCINLLCKITLILPYSVRLWIFNHLRNVQGMLGFLLRYVFIFNLVKSCGKNVRICTGVIFEQVSGLSIGDNVSINQYCVLIASGGIKIGNNVSLAHNCSLVSESHTWSDNSIPICYNPIIDTPITIEDDVWLGCGVRVIGPCKISSRIIIAAGAVVKGVLESGFIYGGIPGKRIKKIIDRN